MLRFANLSYWLCLWLLPTTVALQAQPFSLPNWPEYKGSDLGITYRQESTTFRVWAPQATMVRLLLYKTDQGGLPRYISLQRGPQGTWYGHVSGDYRGLYYTYQVKHAGNPQWSKEVSDPYSIATGVNGLRSAVVDLRHTNPVGWHQDRSSTTDLRQAVILYEMQLRDLSMHSSSGIRQKGKYLGLTETGTRNAAGLSTGLDHLVELGVTHVHLLPFFDFQSSNEAVENPPYNWGYDPQHYNVPEGTFATSVRVPEQRITELKKMVLALHKKGLKLVMDVVYNHTARAEGSPFEVLAPGYYYRLTPDGEFSNASACGNETASEHPMFRRFLIQSLSYWVREYHVDGFRFDLMGIHDIETMQQIADSLRKIKPDILLYGEGWTANSSTLPDSLRAIKTQVRQLKGIAVFGDEFRDGIKGSVFDAGQTGFAGGLFTQKASVQFGVVGATPHPQIDYEAVNYSKRPYADHPQQMIAYADCHDNHTLWDKLSVSLPQYNAAQRKEIQKLSLAMVLTSQGIPFLHAGSEFLRSKKGQENSYNLPDSINAIDWDSKTLHRDVVNMVKSLIDMRKQHPAFRLQDPANRLMFLHDAPQGVIAYTIDADGLQDRWKQVFVVYNARPEHTPMVLPALQQGGKWKPFLVDNVPVGVSAIDLQQITVAPFGCSIFFREQ